MKLFRYLRDAAVFAPCYLLLDWVSYIHPLGAFNITPWNPQPALAIAWMLLGGLAHAPAVWATIFLADVIIRDVPLGITTVTALTLTLGYAGIAELLRLVSHPKPSLQSLRQLTLFIAVVIPSTAVVAAAFIGVLYAVGSLDYAAASPGWLRFWVGDAVGVLVTAPLLLVVADAQGRRSFATLAKRWETYLQTVLLVITLWLIFEGLGGDPSHHFYLVFLPLIWMAIRHGLGGAIVAVGIVQLGVVLAIHHHPVQNLPIIELQALVAALTLTALYLGVMTDERQRAIKGLKHSLRLATAGEMAGAIAHEVNQPLTALTNYARSGQMLIAAGKTDELSGVIERMLAEAQRASEVVRRLRDFFREGSTRLERVPLVELLERVRHDALHLSINALTVSGEPDLPDVLVDRLQIELVLRNLISNAAEVVDGSSGRIALSAQRIDPQHVRIVVSDTGPGIAASRREEIFEPFVSGKPTGMGLGLAVSRAIAEAHGGTLDAIPGGHGEFHLVLPAEATMGENRSLVVYVVDDDASIRDSLTLMLGLAGYATRLFADAESFLVAFRPEWSGCVVADLRLPGLSGIELQSRIRERGSSIPFVIITAHGDVPAARTAFRAQAVDFLEKPFDDAQLRSAIDTAFALETARLDSAELRRDEAAKLARLTPREREVFEHAVSGLHAKEIGEASVSARERSRFTRCGSWRIEVRNIGELVRFALAADKRGGD
jgi:FixJ family two-component response regulator/integral membrane sensor domain MASE1